MQLLVHTPAFDVDAAREMAGELFGITATARALPSERDQNFLLTNNVGEKFVLKIANALESRELLEAQNAMLDHLANHVAVTPRVRQTLSGELIGTRADHLVRLVTYLPGVPLAEIAPHSPELLHDLGSKLGQMDRALADFDHRAVHRDFHWDLANGNRIIDEYSGLVAERELVRKCRVEFKTDLRRSVIHGDANDYNILIEADRVSGLIDFGDIVYSWTIGNLAVALAYVVLGKDDPLSAARHVIDGYAQEFPLYDEEFDVLWKLVRLRLAMSVCLATEQLRQRPENDYLKISQRAIKETLPKLWTL
ncbi:MAG TPA: phosphotransferase [Pyrinomonadaceae bacterium]|nr:phosphotransferase [Pyrinomonadaceae bacterium]